jgi:polyhydroxybutyrate depolymerase
MRILAILAILFLASPIRGATTEIEFDFEGLPRSFAVTIPDGLDAPAPMILALHGLLETGSTMRQRITAGRFDEIAREFGVVVVYPTAFTRVWNLGEGIGAQRIVPRRDDIAYLQRVIEMVQARVDIDPERIFSAGFSQGGIMSFALACKNPGLIRAVGSVAMALPEGLAEDCARHPPDGVVLIHGTEDWVVPIDGGSIASGPGASMALMGHDRSVDFFRLIKGCSGDAETRRFDALDDGTFADRQGWYTCDTGAVEGYRIDGMGHRWPSGDTLLPFSPPIDRTTFEIDGAAAIWGFFSRFQ